MGETDGQQLMERLERILSHIEVAEQTQGNHEA